MKTRLLHQTNDIVSLIELCNDRNATELGADNVRRSLAELEEETYLRRSLSCSIPSGPMSL